MEKKKTDTCSFKIVFSTLRVRSPRLPQPRSVPFVHHSHTRTYSPSTHGFCLPWAPPKSHQALFGDAGAGFEGSRSSEACTPFVNSAHLCKSHEPVVPTTHHHGLMHAYVTETLGGVTTQDLSTRQTGNSGALTAAESKLHHLLSTAALDPHYLESNSLNVALCKPYVKLTRV